MTLENLKKLEKDLKALGKESYKAIKILRPDGMQVTTWHNLKREGFDTYHNIRKYAPLILRGNEITRIISQVDLTCVDYYLTVDKLNKSNTHLTFKQIYYFRKHRFSRFDVILKNYKIILNATKEVLK